MASYKISLIGAPQVGKTSLITRVIAGYCSLSYIPTLGCEVHPIAHNKVIWDCAGDSRFSGLGADYFSDTSLAIIMFSADNPASVPFGLNLLKKLLKKSPNAKVLFIINKIDVLSPDFPIHQFPNAIKCSCLIESTDLKEQILASI